MENLYKDFEIEINQSNVVVHGYSLAPAEIISVDYISSGSKDAVTTSFLVKWGGRIFSIISLLFIFDSNAPFLAPIVIAILILIGSSIVSYYLDEFSTPRYKIVLSTSRGTVSLVDKDKFRIQSIYSNLNKITMR